MVTNLMPDLSLEAYRASWAATLAKSFAPWSKMAPAVWAEQVRKMPGDHGSIRSFTFDFAPHERGMFEAIFDPKNQEVIFMLFSRGGKSEVILTALGYCMSEMPRRILAMWPTVGQAEKWSKDNLMGELIQPTPCLDDLCGEAGGRRKSNNTILWKWFPGGLFNIFGANAPGEIRRAKGDFLYADEIDAIAETQTDEGDPLQIFKKRGSEYPHTIEIYASYPSIKGASRIESKFNESDQRRWFSTCPKCGGEPFIMDRKMIRYEQEKPETAQIECPRCHTGLGDTERIGMARNGRWQATSEFKGKAGFHANAMLWPHPVAPEKYPGGYLQMLAQQEIDTQKSDNPERAKRVLVNTVDAEPYTPEHLSKIEHSDLYKRREKYDAREELPKEVVYVTMGGDLQANRAELFFVGWGFAGGVKQCWALDYRVVRGSPLQNEFWERLEAILSNIAWKHPSGSYLSLGFGLMDSRYRPDEVFSFARRVQKLRVYACEGATTLGKPIVPKKPTKRGVPPAFVYEIGTHEAKDVIYQRLEIADPTKQGFMHFPEIATFGELFFKQLTIEESVMQRGRDGNFYRFFFKKSSDDRNEQLDTAVYACAAEQIARPNYVKLAEELGAEKKPAVIRANPDMGMKLPRQKVSSGGWMGGGGYRI